MRGEVPALVDRLGPWSLLRRDHRRSADRLRPEREQEARIVVEDAAKGEGEDLRLATVMLDEDLVASRRHAWQGDERRVVRHVGTKLACANPAHDLLTRRPE
jgi:hypothetical protein